MDEAERLLDEFQRAVECGSRAWVEKARSDALAAFLAKRVPDAMGRPNIHNAHSEDDWFEDGFNACRERVLRGD